MSFKETLKMKLPFTRKGMEDYLNEQFAQLKEEVNLQLHQRTNDLEQVMIEQLFTQLKEEMNLQLHRRTNDLEQAMMEQLFAQIKEEMNLQLHRRTNDLEQAMMEQLFTQLKEEMNLQLHRRINDLQEETSIQMGAQTAELSALFCAETPAAGLKQANRQIYLFAVASHDSSAVRLAKTFHEMGYAVHYIYGDSDIQNPKFFAVPVVEYSSLELFSIDKLTTSLSTGALFVFTVSNSKFSSYLSFAQKYGFGVICLQNETKPPLPEAAPEKWYSYCDALLQCMEPMSYAVPPISVIVLNHNNREVIFRCVDSLLAFKHRYDYEIIVVDNDSTDGSPEELEARYEDQIVLLRNQKNGCASGRNIGAEAAHGEFLYFLDSDQWVVSPRHLDNALDIMRQAYQVGAVGWGAGWFSQENGALGPISDDFPNRGINSPQVLYRTDVAYLGTDGMFMRKSLFSEIGGFDETYDPTCFEDTDLSLKIKHAGYTLAYCPYMGVLHQPHQTTNSGSDSHNALLKRNAAYFTQKWKELDSSLLDFYI